MRYIHTSTELSWLTTNICHCSRIKLKLLECIYKCVWGCIGQTCVFCVMRTQNNFFYMDSTTKPMAYVQDEKVSIEKVTLCTHLLHLTSLSYSLEVENIRAPELGMELITPGPICPVRHPPLSPLFTPVLGRPG